MLTNDPDTAASASAHVDQAGGVLTHDANAAMLDLRRDSPLGAPDPELSSRDTMLSTLRTVMGLLKEMGEMLVNVPYVKGAAGIMLQILQIHEEVNALQGKWKSVDDDIRQIQGIVMNYMQAVSGGERGDTVRTMDVIKHLKDIRRVLENTLSVMKKCSHNRTCIQTVVRRRELRSAVEECDCCVEKALKRFHIVIDMDTNLRVRGPCMSQSVSVKYTLPAKPEIMHGQVLS
ncbi:hypothetical protein EWM64_g4343 [Hericium alpestre]|uniref:Uncharacterized protein n=1 Tax=Hericium alpestre TaxID=135208 RepID=A0A4Y9ZYS7_9AGAM|nr:hypothetical protein EWM64_g4343 [Hericium alpestre]